MWARHHHYRRQDDLIPSKPTVRSSVEPHDSVEAPAWLADAVSRLEALLPIPIKSGRPVRYGRPAMLAAIVHIVQSGCGWKRLPARFPPYRAVHTQFRRWKRLGVWAKLWEGVTPPFPRCYLQL